MPGRSAGAWKAAIVGAYERGDRNVTIAKLSELAAFYEVPISALLPETAHEEHATIEPGFTVDLAALDAASDPGWATLSRFVASVRALRSDDGERLPLREADLATLALAYNSSPQQFLDLLASSGLLATALLGD